MADEETKNEEFEPETPTDGETETETETEGDKDEFTFVEDPSFDIDYKGDCAYEVKVSIPPANEQKQTSKLLERLKHETALPGFRPGRAPMKLVERKFGKHVKTEVRQQIVDATIRKLAADKELVPIEMPEIEGLDENGSGEGEPLEFTMKFEVGPRVELCDYKSIEVERPVLKVQDEEVDNAIEKMRERYALYETVEDGAAQDGDQVIIDFEGKIDGEPFPGGQAENYPYIIGTQRFFGEFEEVLKGSSPGEHLECEVTFPDDYSTKSLQGETALFDIDVKEIKRHSLPDLDDDFAQQQGYESLDEMRNAVAKGIQENSVKESDAIARDRALEKIIENSTFELPKSLVDKVVDEHYEHELEQLRQLHVPQAEQIEQEEELRRKAREKAEHSFKTYAVIAKIGRAEDVQVTEDDFAEMASEIGQRLGVSADTVAAMLQAEENRFTQMEERLYQRKTLDTVMRHVKTVEKEMGQEEYDKQVSELKS